MLVLSKAMILFVYWIKIMNILKTLQYNELDPELQLIYKPLTEGKFIYVEYKKPGTGGIFIYGEMLNVKFIEDNAQIEIGVSIIKRKVDLSVNRTIIVTPELMKEKVFTYNVLEEGISKHFGELAINNIKEIYNEGQSNGGFGAYL